jgi:adhesin transport system outer membrane protein
MITPQVVSAESLDTVIFKTLASNPQIKAEINRKSIRQYELRQAQAGQYPRVDLLAAVGNENSKNRFTEAAGETDYVDLTRQEEAFVVTYNLFEGFDTTSDIDKSEARVRSANHQLHNLTEQTALSVANAYLRVMQYQELVKLSEETLGIHLQLYKKVKSRSLSGVGRKSDINQAMGRVARARANLVADRASYMNAVSRYLRITGDTPTDLVKPETWDDKLPVSLDAAVDAALENNPVVKAAMADMDAAQSQKKQARSGYYPHFDLVFEQSRGENLDGIEGVEKDYSLMLKMRYNLFNGGYDAARSKQALSQLNESRDNYDDVRRKVTESMRLAWSSYESVKQQMPYLREHVKSIAATRSAYSDQFKIGRRSLLDLLDSENELYQANRSLITAEYDYLVSAYRILANMGKFVDQFELTMKK